MNRIRCLVVALCAALLSQMATAIVRDPCYGAGLAWLLPNNRLPTDPIGFTIDFAYGQYQGVTYHEYKYYWVKASQANSNTFIVDLILSDDPKTFAGYSQVDVDAQNWGFVGPLPPGSYHVLGTVNVYDVGTQTIRPQCDPAIFGPPQKDTLFVVASPENPYFQPARLTQAPLVEYYNAELDHYFMTKDTSEMLKLDTGVYPGWQQTTKKFFAYTNGFINGRGLSQTGVLRFYGLPSAGINSHFFTLSAKEAASIPSAWVMEDNNAFEIWEPVRATGECPRNTLPVYRLWNGRRDSNHRYTISPDVRAEMISKGWIPEGYGPLGVVFCAPAI